MEAGIKEQETGGKEKTQNQNYGRVRQGRG